jgi:hypothetical protein
MVEQNAPSNTPHPCPKPSILKKKSRDGELWACTCGRIYVQRFRYTYADAWFEWVPTGLTTGEVTR